MSLKISELWRTVGSLVPHVSDVTSGTSNEYTRTLMWGYSIMGGFCVLFFGWALLTTISGAVVAPGSIVIQGQVKTVQNLDGGIVAEIAVREGQEVAAGDLLIRLDSSLLTANRAIVEGRLVEAVGRHARLLAERDGAEQLARPDIEAISSDKAAIENTWAAQQAILEARALSRAGQTSQLTARILQLEQEIGGSQGLQIARQEQLELIGRELKGVKELHAQGHAPLTRVLALEREGANLRGQLSELTGAIARLRSLIGETRLQLLQIDKDFREEVLSDLQDASSEVEELREQQFSLLEQLQRTDIRSPVDGKIQELSMHTVGGVVRPAEPILKIVPSDKHLLINVRIDPLNIDQIYVGQSAFVKLTAFNSRIAPDLECRVLNVSADLVSDDRSGLSWYEVDLELQHSEMAKLGDLALVSGMPAEAFIRTSDRTVMTYLLKPLSDQIFRAFREE